MQTNVRPGNSWAANEWMKMNNRMENEHTSTAESARTQLSLADRETTHGKSAGSESVNKWNAANAFESTQRRSPASSAVACARGSTHMYGMHHSKNRTQRVCGKERRLPIERTAPHSHSMHRSFLILVHSRTFSAIYTAMRPPHIHHCVCNAEHCPCHFISYTPSSTPLTLRINVTLYDFLLCSCSYPSGERIRAYVCCPRRARVAAYDMRRHTHNA